MTLQVFGSPFLRPKNTPNSTQIKLWEVQWNQLNDSVQVIQKKAGTENHWGKTGGKIQKRSEWWVDLGALQWRGAVLQFSEVKT